MKILPLILSLTLLSLLTKPVFAATSSVSIKNQINTGNTVHTTSDTSSNTNISISESEGDTTVEVKNNEFTISGTVKSVSGGKINVSGQNITFPSNLASPAVGQKVTVKGTVASSGEMTATSISVTGEATNSVLGTNTEVNVNTTTSSSPTPTPTGSLTASPSSSASVSADITLEDKGEISKLLDQLQKIINLLFSVLSR